MTLADFTSPGLIVPQLRGRDVPSVIQELSQALQREKRVPDLLLFYHNALNREFLLSTDWEAGMAIPHARLPGLKELSFALGRSIEPLRWGGNTFGQVRLVFLIAVPATDATEYLKLISCLARLAREDQFVAKLHGAKTTVQIHELLQQARLQPNPPAPNGSGYSLSGGKCANIAAFGKIHGT